MPALTGKVKPPRALHVKVGERGKTLGAPGETDLHLKVVEAALKLLETAREGGTIVTLDGDGGV